MVSKRNRYTKGYDEEEDDGWITAYAANGSKGFVPRGYIEGPRFERID